MKPQIYSIKDGKAGSFLPPFLAVNDALAVRQIREIMSQQVQFSKYADDFSLYRLAAFDQDTGELIPETPKFIINFVTLKEA